MTTNDDNDDEIYPTVKITRGGELPEGATESGNEESDNDRIFDKTTKYDPHRALNIDLDEKPKEKISNMNLKHEKLNHTKKLTDKFPKTFQSFVLMRRSFMWILTQRLSQKTFMQIYLSLVLLLDSSTDA